jgi:6-pyruvoyl-tetrahydropterin synthase
VVDFNDIKHVILETLDKVDHKLLNDVQALENPTLRTGGQVAVAEHKANNSRC